MTTVTHTIINRRNPSFSHTAYFSNVDRRSWAAFYMHYLADLTALLSHLPPHGTALCHIRSWTAFYMHYLADLTALLSHLPMVLHCAISRILGSLLHALFGGPNCLVEPSPHGTALCHIRSWAACYMHYLADLTALLSHLSAGHPPGFKGAASALFLCTRMASTYTPVWTQPMRDDVTL